MLINFRAKCRSGHALFDLPVEPHNIERVLDYSVVCSGWGARLYAFARSAGFRLQDSKETICRKLRHSCGSTTMPKRL